MSTVVTGDTARDPGIPLTRYYTESGNRPGTWMGSGLTSLTTGGEGITVGATVTEEQLARLLGQGVNPITGEPLGRPYPVFPSVQERIDARVRQLDAGMSGAAHATAVQQVETEERARDTRRPVAGFDFTFSPPKSVSALWAVADGATQQAIVQAHHAAVADVLGLMEERVAFTRTGYGGVARMHTTGLLAAGFDHHDSRTGDPQLHTHLVVANKVQGVDGVWRSLDSRLLHRATVALSETYDAFLADHITAATGLDWVLEARGADRRPGWELAGVPSRLREVFSTRTLGRPASAETGEVVVGIAERTDALIAAYREKQGRTPSRRVVVRLRQQATLETRPVKEARVLAEQMRAWRATAATVLGRDATGWATGLVSQAVHPRVAEPTPDAADRAERLARTAANVVAVLGDARASWTTWNLWAEAVRQSRGLIFATTAERTVFLTGVVEQAERGSVRLTPVYDRSTPAGMVLPDGSSGFQPADTVRYTSQALLDAETRLLALAADTTAPTVAPTAVEVVAGVRRLSVEQRTAVEHVAASGRVVDVLVGAAGTGKTSTLATLRQVWEAGHGAGSVVGLAPSAAAVDILGRDLGVVAENTARFLTLMDHGRAVVRAGQLVIVDEASLAGTLTLNRLATLTARAGAKLLLVGDWAQLSAVDAGGAFALLAKEHPGAELSETHRFTRGWEKAATLRLRTGDTDVAATYAKWGRLHAGSTEEMIDAAYTAWRTDQTAGLGSVLIAPTNDLAAVLNARAHDELVTAGRVSGLTVSLRDGTRAGRGDRIITRQNDSALRDGYGRVKNRDTWTVTKAHRDGGLTVRRTRTNGIPYGKTLRLPATYVAGQVTLGYAITTHQAQGITTGTAHAILPENRSREGAYVALTRGRDANHAYLPTDTPVAAAPVDGEHLGFTPVTDPAVLLARILAKVGAEQAATLVHRAEQQAHTSAATLWAEYETLATQASQAHYADLLTQALPDAGPVTGDRGYPALTRTLRTFYGAGYDTDRLLVALARTLPDHTENPADVLRSGVVRMVDSGRIRRGVPRLVAGLTPAAPTGDPDYQNALTQRVALIQAAAAADLKHAYEQKAAWLPRHGRLPAEADTRAITEALRTVTAYRAKHSVTSPNSPLGPAPEPGAEPGLMQEFQNAEHAYRHAIRTLTQAETPGHGITRAGARRDGPTLGL